MRVLLNTYPVAFDCPGGGEIQLLRYREALEHAGVEVLLYDVWRPQLDAVDVVHYFSVQGGSMNFCAHVKRRGLPLVISPILWLTEANRAQLPLGEIRDLLHLCDRILPNSGAERDQLAAAFQVAPAKFTVVPNGVDATFLQPACPDLFRCHFGLDRPFLLNVANVEPRKNQVRLIEAIAGLDLMLVILGHVRDEAYWQECRRVGKGQVRHLGHVPHGSDLLKSAYQSGELFALPSVLETPGLAALEAAALGARVVVTREGSAREYFGDQVEYVDPLSVPDIRRGIDAALCSAPDRRLAQSIVRDFTWDRAAPLLRNAYAQAMGEI